MRPILPAAAAAALLSVAGAANAQAPAEGARQLSWPGKRAAPAPAELRPVAAPPSAASYEPVAVPPPFTAASAGPRINNRYSARGTEPRRVAFAAMAPTPIAPAPVPAYTPAPSFPTADYGPPVIPNEVKPARVISAPEPVRPQPAPVREAPTRLAPVIAERPAAAPAPTPRPQAPVVQAVQAPVQPPVAAQAPMPSPPVARASAPAPTQAPAAAAAPAAAPAPVATAAPVGDRPFIRPASPNGPRFYSVHREFGGLPDATLRSRPTGPATERLPTGFFGSGEAAAEDEDEPQDDAETRAAALRAAEKATKAKGKKR